MRKSFARSVVFAGSFGFLAGCGSPTENLKEEGLTTYDKPEVTTTCYDYAGNAVLTHKANTDRLEVKPAGVVVNQDGHQPTIVPNGGGCIATERYFDHSLPANSAQYKSATDKAQVYGVVTNSSDAVLFSGKFNEVSYDESKGTVSFKLKSAKGTDMMKVTITGGLNVIATDNVGNFGQAVRAALPEAKVTPGVPF